MPKTLKALLKPGAMLAAMVAGATLPGCSNTIVIRYCLMTMLFIMFIPMHFGDIKIQRTHLRVLALNFVMALLPYALFQAAGRRDLALAAFWTGIAPTATAAPVVMGFLGGQVSYVLTGFVLTNAFIPLSLPLLLVALSGHFSWSSFLPIAWNIVQLIGVPLYLARIVRMAQPRAIGFAKRLKGLSFALWVVMLFYIAADASRFIHSQDGAGTAGAIWAIAAVSLVICMLNFSIGYAIGHKGLRRESSQTLGQKNTSLTIYLALTYANPLAALGPTFYVFWHNAWNALQLYLHARKANNGKSDG
ncbi:MAG TPA: hypothetical protein PLE35_03850 [Lentisphaeria bacterium]|nr:hypothetical protein [Lentisphaeria bacterium]